MANFARAKNEIEPYDDLEQLRGKNMGQRLADLRMQIYKHRKNVISDSPNKRTNHVPKKDKLKPTNKKLMSMTQKNFGVRHASRASKMSEDLSEIYLPETLPNEDY